MDVLSVNSEVSVVFTSLVGKTSDDASFVSTTSPDANSSYVARSWINAARFAGRVISIKREITGGQLELEVRSTPGQDILVFNEPPASLAAVHGVIKSGTKYQLPLQAGVLGDVERATAVVIPRSAVERQRLKSIIESNAL
jgi:hypothetical protein